MEAKSTCHEMVIDLLKRFIYLYEMFIFCTFTLVLNMIFTLTLKHSREMSKLSASIFSKRILWCERTSVGIFIDIFHLTTVNPLYNDAVCSKLSLTLK